MGLFLRAGGVVATVVAAGVLYQRVGLARQRREFAPPGSMIDVGGHRLHVNCRGAGSPGSPIVVFESGIAASSLSWSLVAPAVAAFTRVCAYDRAGLGWSESPSSPASSDERPSNEAPSNEAPAPPWSFERIVRDHCAVLDRVGLNVPHGPHGQRQKFILVGHSFGSFVVRAVAARRPEQVAGLVLVDPATEWLTANPQRSRLLRGGRQLSRVGALLAHAGVVRACLALLTGGAPGAPRNFVKIFGPTTSHTLERLVGEVRKLPPELHPTVRALWCQPKCFHAMADHMSVLERGDPLITAVTVPRDIPVVVLSGGNQPAEQLAAHRVMAEASDRGRHVVASKSAHWIQFDEPQLIVDAVKEMAIKA
jgi:pimeloyl-ACP methyl ester carboxylesterase